MILDKKLIQKAYQVLYILLDGSKCSHTIIVEQAKFIVFNTLNIDENSSDSAELIDTIVNLFEQEVGIQVFDPDVLAIDYDGNDWLKAKKDKVSHAYFTRYRHYLLNEGFVGKVIDNIEDNCEKILSYSCDPSNQFDTNNQKKRGLVIGDVQSGKTANYLGLINMACDNGYKIIVLLAGMTDSLRQQTQTRVDTGFIGAESNTISSTIKFVGVGENVGQYFSVPLTNVQNDFVKFVKDNNNATSGDFNKPIVLVVKKNSSVLEQVQKWLKPGKNNISCDSVLIIDDEADNASVNTKKSTEKPSIINGLIRSIYNNFRIATYVGYTATPFANIFINPDDDENNRDLFPSDFIIQLHAPDNYFGSTKVFPLSEEKQPRCIRLLDEKEPGFLHVVHKKDAEFTYLPESLKEAILTFLINNVIRTRRGHKFKHRSMMINISRLNALQEDIKDQVEKYINKLMNIINQDCYKVTEEFIKNSEMGKLYLLFHGDFYSEIRNEVSWKEVKDGLGDEMNQFVVAVINNRYKNENRFDYNKYSDKGARVIVIGGFVLSRGLTLEGLMMSYFSRNASAYDTMLQMCRWFGYRPKYEDLCLVYISKINIDCFKAILDAVNDLKNQLHEMSIKGKTPNDFGLMIQESPETLETAMLITSRNKMINTIVLDRYLNYGGIYVDTSKLFKDNTCNLNNLRAFASLVNRLKEEGILLSEFNHRNMFRGVEKHIIAKFLDELKLPLENRKFDRESLSGYISYNSDFPTWDIVIATGDKKNQTWIVDNKTLPRVERSFEIRDEENYLRIGDTNNRIIDPGIFNSGLSIDQIEKIKSVAKDKDNLTAKDYLGISNRRPLLVLYPIDLNIYKDNEIIEEKEDAKRNFKGDVLLGFAIGFPNIGGAKVMVKYRANKIKVSQLANGIEEEDEEEFDND